MVATYIVDQIQQCRLHSASSASDHQLHNMEQMELEYEVEPSVEPEVRACVASLVSAVSGVFPRPPCNELTRSAWWS